MVISKMDIIILTMQAAFKIGFVGNFKYRKVKNNQDKKNYMYIHQNIVLAIIYIPRIPI